MIKLTKLEQEIWGILKEYDEFVNRKDIPKFHRKRELLKALNNKKAIIFRYKVSFYRKNPHQNPFEARLSFRSGPYDSNAPLDEWEIDEYTDNIKSYTITGAWKID